MISGNSFTFSKGEFFYLSLSGIIGLGFGDWLLFESFLLLGPQLSMLIFTSSPLITLLLSLIFLKEKISLLDLLGIILVITGICLALIKNRLGKIILKGVIFSFLGALMQSIGLILAKKALNTGIDTLLATFLRIVPAFIFILILFKFFRKYSKEPLTEKRKKGYLFLILGSIIGPYLGVWFSQISIKYAPTGISATLLSLSPIFLIPLSKILEKENITILRVLGTIISLSGIFILLNY